MQNIYLARHLIESRRTIKMANGNSINPYATTQRHATVLLLYNHYWHWKYWNSMYFYFYLQTENELQNYLWLFAEEWCKYFNAHQLCILYLVLMKLLSVIFHTNAVIYFYMFCFRCEIQNPVSLNNIYKQNVTRINFMFWKGWTISSWINNRATNVCHILYI